MKKLLGIFGLLTVLVLVGIIFVYLPRAKADSTGSTSRQVTGYESIRIHKGETLTSIAQKRTDGTTSEVQWFINETARMNGINPDKITAGCYICVPIVRYNGEHGEKVGGRR